MEKNKSFYTYFISFMLPIVVYGFVLVLHQVYPFGNKTILMGDLYTQYIQFYNHFYDVLKGDGSLLYAWESGMGLNFWGTFTYYLSSPLSFVILLFNKAHLPEAILLITLLKIGLSGLTMSIYLRSQIQSRPIAVVTFSTMYALMSYEIGYFFNLMWLDSLYLLPLVLLGIERLFEKKYTLFIVSLTFLFITNFYMSFIVGIFAFLYFIIRIILIENSSWRTVQNQFIKFFICVLFAAGISAFTIIPTYLQLKANPLPSFEWNLGSVFSVNINFIELIAKIYNGSIRLFDDPNIYGGLLTLLLFPLFFYSKKIHVKEKVIFFLLLLFFIVSFQIQGINIIWHAFQIPTGYKQRFAFLLTFTIIYLAYRVFIILDKDQIRDLFGISFINIATIVILTAISPDLMSMQKAILNIIFLILFTFILYAKVVSIKYEKLIHIVLFTFVLFDVGINSYLHMRTLYSYPGYNYTRDQYNIYTPGFEEVVNKLKNEDGGFYRINSHIQLTKNDSIRYKYKSMDNFNTLSNGTLHDFMHRLGYSTTIGSRSLVQNKGIISSDSLFGFKYEITEKPINKQGYVESFSEVGTILYENKNILPIGFLVSKEQFRLSNEDNPFINQNILLGGEGNYFTRIEPIETKYYNLTVNEINSILYIKKNIPDEEGYIEYTFDLKGDKQFYTLLSAGKGFKGFGETMVYVNGESLGVYPTFHYERILDLGAFSNTRVTIKIAFTVPETQLTQKYFYTLNYPAFEERVNELIKGAFTLKDYTDRSVKGEITAKQPDTLFFSIPFDEGWHAKVDGKEVPIVKLGGFIGVDIDQGTHHVTLRYTPKGFIFGCTVSIVSLIVLIIIIFINSGTEWIKFKKRR